jgi:tRNA dimethylallyltransferase
VNLAKIYAQRGDMDRAEVEAKESADKWNHEESKQILAEIKRIRGISTGYKDAKPCDDIVIVCPPQGAYLWDADIAKEKSMGGSEIAAIEMEGRLPILVGGTGLYFRALTEGLSDIPPVPDEVRAELRTWAEDKSAEDIHARLEAVDPATAARLRPSDPQRNLRALEVFTATGKPLSAFHDSRSGAVLDIAECVAVFLEPDREVLRQRIDARFDAMMENGAIDEVEALMVRGLDPALPAMRAHGVPGLIRGLRNKISVEEAVAIGKADTRRYAKRQHTWFRHQAPAFEWVRVEEAEGRVLSLVTG